MKKILLFLLFCCTEYIYADGLEGRYIGWQECGPDICANINKIKTSYILEVFFLNQKGKVIFVTSDTKMKPNSLNSIRFSFVKKVCEGGECPDINDSSGILVFRAVNGNVKDVELRIGNENYVLERCQYDTYATIHNVWLEHAKIRNGLNGMIVHAEVTAHGIKGHRMKGLAYFYDSKKNKLIQTKNCYETIDDQVCASDVLSYVDYDESYYHDFDIFMPYTYFPFSPGKHTYYVKVDFYDETTKRFLSDSRFYVSFEGTGTLNEQLSIPQNYNYQQPEETQLPNINATFGGNNWIYRFRLDGTISHHIFTRDVYGNIINDKGVLNGTYTIKERAGYKNIGYININYENGGKKKGLLRIYGNSVQLEINGKVYNEMR